MQAKLFAARTWPLKVDIVLLLTRMVCGSAFVLIGWGKIQHPLDWMGPDSAFPGFLQALAALSEFGGGLALILGLLTRLGAFGLTVTMVVAVYMHRFVYGDPFVNLAGGGSYQLPAVYLLVALLLLAMGPGRFSLDRLLFGAGGRKNGAPAEPAASRPENLRFRALEVKN